jgi:hypothetical protein
MANSGKILSKKCPRKGTPDQMTQGTFIDMKITGLRSNAIDAFERTSYPWSNAQHTVDRR